MEKIVQSLSTDGLQIPLTLMRQYGLEPGAAVTLELHPDGIRVTPMQVDATQIENRALSYLIRHVGDTATVKVQFLSSEEGWLVKVYGQGMKTQTGNLRYTSTGMLLPDISTPPDEIRHAAS